MLYHGIRTGAAMGNGDEPATRADLQQLEAKLSADLNRLEAKLSADLNQQGEQLRSEFHHGFDHLAEAIHDSETRLLKAFYTFAESNQQRLTQVEGNTTAVIARLATLETRITEVEKRLNMPPAA
jgi:DNA anti-recombination protein RmuC